MIEFSKIRIDGGTQARADLNQETIAEYAEAYRAGVAMPPVVVFYDGTTYWLADGFHRYFGAKQAGKETIHEEVTPGSQRDAVLFSLGANAKHGLRRSNADKRKAVQILLADVEWAKWSSNEIAKRCAVSHTFVDEFRRSLATVASEKPAERTVITKHGTATMMNTASIGKAPAAPIRPALVAAAAAKETARAATIGGTGEVVDGQSELEALCERLDELAANLKGAVEDNESMGRVFEANDQVAAAIAEATKFREMNRVLESRVTGLMNQLAEVKRLLKSAQRRAEKAEAALVKEVA